MRSNERTKNTSLKDECYFLLRNATHRPPQKRRTRTRTAPENEAPSVGRGNLPNGCKTRTDTAKCAEQSQNHEIPQPKSQKARYAKTHTNIHFSQTSTNLAVGKPPPTSEVPKVHYLARWHDPCVCSDFHKGKIRFCTNFRKLRNFAN